MATTTNTKRKQPTKAQVTKVAKCRRNGKGWAAIIEETGVKGNATSFRELLEAHGFDNRGLKLDGSGPRESKARVMPAAATKKRLKTLKANGKSEAK